MEGERERKRERGMEGEQERGGGGRGGREKGGGGENEREREIGIQRGESRRWKMCVGGGGRENEI